jgi:hypothetical protein
MPRPPILRIALFRHGDHGIFRGTRDIETRYGHTFGTDVDYKGLRPGARKPPVHVLMRLNSDDDAVDVRISGIRWIPLLCAIRYDACNLGYRVESDDRVKIISQEVTKAEKNSPYPGYPDRLAIRPIAFRRIPLVRSRPGDLMKILAVFGPASLSKREFSTVRQYVIRKRILRESWGYRNVDEFLREDLAWPFIQGRPKSDCPDRTCKNHGKNGTMSPFAVFEEDGPNYWESVESLWGPHSESLQIIYEYCPRCFAIFTTNQCT